MRQEIEQQYQIENGVIQTPGKFEGEPLYIPYFWGKTLESCENEIIYDDDDDETPISIFLIDEKDRAEFPELNEVEKIHLWEAESGFVYSRSYQVEKHKHDAKRMYLSSFGGLGSIIGASLLIAGSLVAGAQSTRARQTDLSKYPIQIEQSEKRIAKRIAKPVTLKSLSRSLDNLAEKAASQELFEEANLIQEIANKLRDKALKQEIARKERTK